MDKGFMMSSVQSNNLVRCHRSEKYVVAVETAVSKCKLFQIMFQKKDGSIFVNFPYFKYRDGIVSLVTWTPQKPPPANLSLEPGGKATSHLVKYSHHPDGRAHFSQDKKVLTAIKKQSVPISQIEGHIFTIQLQGLRFFEALEADETIEVPTAKRTILKFFLGSQEPGAVKIVGRLYSQVAILKRLKNGIVGKVMTLNDPHGKAYAGFICSAPEGHAAQDRILILSCENIPRIDKDEETALTFIGGFDKPEIVNNLAATTTFIAFSYPVKDADKLVKMIGSIDFIAKN